MAAGLFSGVQQAGGQKGKPWNEGQLVSGTALLALGVVALKAREEDLHRHLHGILQMAAPFLSGFGEGDLHLRSCRISFIEMIGRAISKAAGQLHATVIMDHVDKVGWCIVRLF